MDSHNYMTRMNACTHPRPPGHAPRHASQEKIEHDTHDLDPLPFGDDGNDGFGVEVGVLRGDGPPRREPRRLSCTPDGASAAGYWPAGKEIEAGKGKDGEAGAVLPGKFALRDARSTGEALLVHSTQLVAREGRLCQ